MYTALVEIRVLMGYVVCIWLGFPWLHVILCIDFMRYFGI